MLHLTQDNYTVSRWAGGTTVQIAIYPPDASYGARDFLWRVSSAAVEDERSTFTPLPDYDRRLMLLDGSLLLSHDGGEPFRLDAYRTHAFDGGAVTGSQGRCRDFNLMLRKGRCSGELRPIRLAKAGGELVRFHRPKGGFSRSALLLYCAAGWGQASLAGETCQLTEGESLLAEDVEDAALRLRAPGPADFVAAEIWY